MLTSLVNSPLTAWAVNALFLFNLVSFSSSAVFGSSAGLMERSGTSPVPTGFRIAAAEGISGEIILDDTMRPCIELVWIIPAAYWVPAGPAAADSSTSGFVSGVAGLD